MTQLGGIFKTQNCNICTIKRLFETCGKSRVNSVRPLRIQPLKVIQALEEVLKITYDIIAKNEKISSK